MSLQPAHKRLVMDYCHREFYRQVQFLHERFDLDNYDPVLYLTWRPGLSSTGGTSTEGLFISLALWEIADLVVDASTYEFPEYPFIANDPDIGTKVMNWKEWVARTIAHELAHTLTINDGINRDARDQILPFFSPKITTDRRPHGIFWQAVYRVIARDYLRLRSYEARPLITNLRRRVKIKDKVEYVSYYNGRRIAFQFLREDGVIYRCDRGFKKPRQTSFGSFHEVRRWILSRH